MSQAGAATRCRELQPKGRAGHRVAIVALASRGLTNPQIADRLVLLVRTVESHLYNAMLKLGISNR